jgi:hypothetical protein
MSRWILLGIFAACSLVFLLPKSTKIRKSMNVSRFYSQFFEEALDWTGILIEPSPVQFAKIKRPRAFSVNAAICANRQTVHWVENGLMSGIHEFMAPTFLARFHPNLGTRTPIECVGFDVILRDITHVDLFSLDVEGAEYQALLTFPFDRISVSVWLIEADDTNVKKNRNVTKLLKKKGYRLVGKIVITEIYLRKVHVGHRPNDGPIG